MADEWKHGRHGRWAAVAGWVASAGLAVQPAFAWQDFREVRISGAEIVDVVLREPEPEDPFVLALTLTDGQTLEIESDMGLERCAEDARFAVGDRNSILEIRVWTNAQSMNSVIVVGCAVTNGLVPPE